MLLFGTRVQAFSDAVAFWRALTRIHDTGILGLFLLPAYLYIGSVPDLLWIPDNIQRVAGAFLSPLHILPCILLTSAQTYRRLRK